MAHVFKKGKIYYVRYKDEAGKWRKKSCSINATKADAEYLAREYSAKELNYHHKSPVRILDSPLKEVLEDFKTKILRRGHRGNTKEESSILREQTVIDNLNIYLESQNVTKIKEMDYNFLLTYFDYRRGQKMSPRTIGLERQVLRKFFVWAMEMNYCTENPVEKIAVPKLQDKKPRFFNDSELQKIFTEAKPPYNNIYRFLFLTGIRIGELSNLQWNDWFEDRKRLKIRVVSGDKKHRVPGNKTKREEEIPLSNDAMEILKQQKALNHKGPFIFLNDYGNPLDNDNIYRNLKRLLINLEIVNAHPHTFRHTCASHLVIKGVSLYTVKEILRHKSIKETEIYAHLSHEAIQKAVDMLSVTSILIKKEELKAA